MSVTSAVGDWQLEVLDEIPRHTHYIIGVYDSNGYWQAHDYHIVMVKDGEGKLSVRKDTYSLEKCVNIWHNQAYYAMPERWRIRNVKTHEVIPCAVL